MVASCWALARRCTRVNSNSVVKEVYDNGCCILRDEQMAQSMVVSTICCDTFLVHAWLSQTMLQAILGSSPESQWFISTSSPPLGLRCV